MVPDLWCDRCYERTRSEGEGTVDELRVSMLVHGWSRRLATPEETAPLYIELQDGMVDLCLECTDEDEVAP